jgi:hypothetical protein
MPNNIRPELQRLSKPITSMQAHPSNVRQGDVGIICQSLEHHGQYRPIVVHKSTNNILAGNHTWQAANALGWDKIACTYVDCDDEQALRILLADNRANDLATYDDAALAELLKELANSEGLEGTLFEPSDLDDLLAMLDEPLLPNFNTDDDDATEKAIVIRVSLAVHERWHSTYVDLSGDTDDERILSLLNAYDNRNNTAAKKE